MILLSISLSLVPEPVEGCRNRGRIILSVILSFTLHFIFIRAHPVPNDLPATDHQPLVTDHFL